MDVSKQIKQKFWISFLIGSLIVITALYSTIGIIDGNLFEYYIGIPSYIIIPAIPIVMFIWATKFSGTTQIIPRKSLLFFGASFSCWFVGEQIWLVYGYILNLDPFPSPADFFYILGYPLMFLGLMVFLIPLRKLISKTTLSFSVVVSVVVLIPSLSVSFISNLEYDIIDFFFALAYPVLDSLLLVPTIMILVLFSTKKERSLFWLLMALGIIIYIVADTFFLFLDMNNLYYDGHPVDVLWLYSKLIFSFAIYGIIYAVKNSQTTNTLSFEIDQKHYEKNTNKLGIPIMLIIINVTVLMLMVGINYFWKQSMNADFILLISIMFFGIIVLFSIIVSHFSHKANSLLEIKNKKIDEQFITQSNLKNALDESSDVAITDKNGTIIYVNDNFCTTSKYSREELIGKNHRVLKSGQHSPEFYEHMWKTIILGNVWHDQIKNKAKDGTFYWNDMVIVPFLDKNKEIMEFIAIRRNITERKKLHAEKLKNEKMVTVGRLSARLAHDLRNPLSIIRLSLENLKIMIDIDEKKQKQFDKVDRSIDRIIHQVNNVLDFVKGQPIKPYKTKISKVISESLDSLVIPDTVKLNLPENDFNITCDKGQLATALNNLILNGIQAISKSGTITIRVKDMNDSIIIEVEDSGKGIPQENLDEIFEPLFTTKMEGTGLGLVSVLAIVDAHKGAISVTSHPTIFKIILPKILD